MLEPIQAHLIQASLIDLDGTFLVQLGIFIVFAVLLNYLVVQPVLRAQQERYARMQGARIEAESMDLHAAKAYEDYQQRIAAARRDAMLVRDDMRKAAESASAKMLAQVREEAQRSVDSGREVLASDAEKVRMEMAPKVEEIAGAVADRLLPGSGDAA